MNTLTPGKEYDMRWVLSAHRGWLCDTSAASKLAEAADVRDWFQPITSPGWRGWGRYLGPRFGLTPKFA